MNVTDKAVEAFIEAYKLECDHRYDPDAIRTALTAALPHMGGVSVKPLEWHGPDANGENRAHSILCVYTIRAAQGSLGYWLTEVGGYFPDIESAKAAAQADYERRILSALSPAPVGVTDISLLHGIRDSLRASINEYRDADVFPGARVIMQEQLNALTDALSSHEPTPETKRGIEDAKKRIAETPSGTMIDNLPDEVLFGDHSDENPNVGQSAPTDTQAGEVMAWASPMACSGFVLIADKASASFHEGQGLEIIPLVRQSALTACQQEIERLRREIDHKQKAMSSQAEQWTRSMAGARREGMEEAARRELPALPEELHEHYAVMSVQTHEHFVKEYAKSAIRAKAQEAR